MPTRIFGVDFTSRPTPRKPIVVACGTLTTRGLSIARLQRFPAFALYEHWLAATPGPWVGGFDFPFGLPRAFVDAHLPSVDWRDLVTQVAAMDREAFCRLTWPAFRAARGRPDLKHRQVDRGAGSHSPLKTMDPDRRIAINPPVGLMFYEGAPRLLAAGLDLPAHGLRPDPLPLGASDRRVALEAYPGMLARQSGERFYKNDKPATARALRAARRRLIAHIAAPPARLPCPPCSLSAPLQDEIIADASGDALDAVLCAVQAAAAARLSEAGWGLPAHIDPVEGWIAGAAATAPH